MGTDGREPGLRFPTPDRQIDELRFDLDAVAYSFVALSSYQGGPRAKERIKDDVADSTRVAQHICYELAWLDGGVLSEEWTLSAEDIHASILPDVTTRPAVLAQFHIVAMRCPWLFEDANQFVL